MNGFKLFFEQTKEQEKNIKKTLAKLPKKFSALIKDYKLKWHNDNTLSGDDEHIGLINPIRKTITLAAPWNYGREYTFLHEIGHKVFENFMTDELMKEWKEVLKKTKHKLNQNPEELWCMAFANQFAENKIVVHTHPEWEAYMKKFIKMKG
jgi:cytochrome b involved in lipid metabolism